MMFSRPQNDADHSIYHFGKDYPSPYLVSINKMLHYMHHSGVPLKMTAGEARKRNAPWIDCALAARNRGKFGIELKGRGAVAALPGRHL